jgi:hypothetical protein
MSDRMSNATDQDGAPFRLTRPVSMNTLDNPLFVED